MRKGKTYIVGGVAGVPVLRVHGAVLTLGAAVDLGQVGHEEVAELGGANGGRVGGVVLVLGGAGGGA